MLSTERCDLSAGNPGEKRPRSRIGAHVSVAGGLTNGVDRATAIGAECIQIFVGAPQRWSNAKYTAEEAEEFKRAVGENNLNPVFIHGPYLVNLASKRGDVRAISRRVLVSQLEWAEKIGAVGVIVHVGSGGDNALDLAEAGLRDVLTKYSGSAKFLLENDAGAGQRIGKRFSEIGRLIKAADNDERLGVCFDTCHALVSGYEIRERDSLDATMEEFDAEIGLDRLVVVHANDSKGDLGSNKDRHENIGEGEIGEDSFEMILSHNDLRGLPFVLEVPGYDKDGPDARNVSDLIRLAEGS